MKNKVLLYSLGVLFFVPLLFPLRSELVLFPGKKNYRVHAFNDIADSAGNSLSAVSLDTGKAILFDYTLRKHAKTEKTPFAGFVLTLTESDSFVDISSYDSICIDIVTKQATSFKINLKTFIDGYTVLGAAKENVITYHYEQCEVLIHLGAIRYSKSLKYDFKIPEFMIPHMKGLPLAPNNAKLFSIDFQSGSGTAVDVPDRFTITKISFIKEHEKDVIALICGICFALYCLLLFVINFISRNPKKSSGNTSKDEIIKDPPPIVFPDNEEKETTLLIEYINSHYQEPELTLEQVAQGAQILPPLRVTSKLQQKFNMNFRQYLNDLRIRESKRLLSHTDKNISEIAFAVGYNNIPHFNRVFKEVVGIAPTQYRDNNQELTDNTKS
jgi:AraC-like DNA-binding protein